MVLDLEERAKTIPDMGGRRIGGFLRECARNARPDGCIVELGCWLGAGTSQMALGVLDREDRIRLPIHCFDNFHTSESSATKAANQGAPEIKEGSDTLLWVTNALKPFGDFIHLHKGMIDAKTRWNSGPISLFVDDATKYTHTFHHCLGEFAPSWIPGQTVVILMDYYLFRKQKVGTSEARIASLRSQHDFVTGHPKSFLPLDTLKDGVCAAFLYTHELDWNEIPKPNWPQKKLSPAS